MTDEQFHTFVTDLDASKPEDKELIDNFRMARSLIERYGSERALTIAASLCALTVGAATADHKKDCSHPQCIAHEANRDLDDALTAIEDIQDTLWHMGGGDEVLPPSSTAVLS